MNEISSLSYHRVLACDLRVVTLTGICLCGGTTDANYVKIKLGHHQGTKSRIKLAFDKCSEIKPGHRQNLNAGCAMITVTNGLYKLQRHGT